PGEDGDKGGVMFFRGSPDGLVHVSGYTQSGLGVGSREAGDRFGATIAVTSLSGYNNNASEGFAVASPGENYGGSTSAHCGMVSLLRYSTVAGGLEFDANVKDPNCVEGNEFGAALAGTRAG